MLEEFSMGTYVVGLQVGSNLSLGSVSVGQQLLLVVKQFLSRLGSVLNVGSLQSKKMVNMNF